MTWEAVQIAIVGALVAVVFLGFVRERLPPDVVAMLAFSVLNAHQPAAPLRRWPS